MKQLIILAIVVILASPLPAYSTGYGYVQNQDMQVYKKEKTIVCDQPGEKWIGISYSDVKKSDIMDAITVICASPNGDKELANNDFGNKKRIRIKCNNWEDAIGIAYKDRSQKDSVDGATMICQDKKTKTIRMIYNADIQGGRRFTQMKSPQAIGIVYHDLKGSDGVDGVSVVYKK